ncbi:iron-only hydrogenase system regulator [Marinitoga sp. 1135]|uniref:Putative iron-only hydrogenase system regulator n=1 Tax=Marinitoga piezophila (strain DSM 14283 / JCM 11233 / KA3) TaxID=443254 RepID=H2J342_MARPK|nr:MULTISPECIES: TM1266 family iron-only hydrogenase system putative regulator [Marinitoga]AEX84560.1 putative iron-only hydrogenase system regulator [Marinitoga piezophila KA3]APT75085.1 iron-only hydrogenase system regulator [Marinitoga sp. 1137]NUU94858.1 iron-only hydrogenase system regulator [Marinitoga sp. 1135]NUU96796.1 iron-only hydrogenase system regulator [Marinitoga sp. 1138]
MEKKISTLSIIIYNRDLAYQKVSDLLHNYGEKILLRVGYPMKEKGIAIIFLVVEMTTDELGALSGKLGQIDSVKVKSTTLKI